jgi:multiple sugar transport system permease protein
MLSVFFYGFFDYNMLLSKNIKFIAFSNYKKLFTDPMFYKSLYIALKWVALNILFQIILGMAIAMLITKRLRGAPVIRTLIISPYAVSGVLASTLWLFMFQDNFGLINDILKRLNFITVNIGWISKANFAMLAAVIAETWRYTPFFIIIFSAALQSIPVDLYEAAKIDGANGFNRFISITLPLLSETVVFTCILRMVWEFNSVDIIYSLTKGGPVNETTTLAMYIVKTAINNSDMGYGSTLTVVSFIILAIFSFLLIKISKIKKENMML